jgi:hypothetical protein
MNEVGGAPFGRGAPAPKCALVRIELWSELNGYSASSKFPSLLLVNLNAGSPHFQCNNIR